MQNLSMEDVIKLRHSVRIYKNQEIPEELMKKVDDFIQDVESPFTGSIKIKIVKQGYSEDNKKLGTYGMIKGATNFIVAVCEGHDSDYLSVGYVLEMIILHCTSLGLGTCFLGGTFHRGSFAKAIQLKSNEIIPIVSPLGFENDKTSFIRTLLKKNSFKRKEFNEIFFLNDFNTSLTKEGAKEYVKILDMVRLAPSAMNKQPWRIVKENSNFHFYMDGKLKMQRIDMGIALCHFERMAKELNILGEFKFQKPKIESKFEYITSWVV